MIGRPSPETVDHGDPERIADAVAARFASRTGRRPDGVWSAPGRVNLVGEHTDYNGGRCLPIALPHATIAAVGRRGDDRLTAHSDLGEHTFDGPLDRLGPGDVRGWSAYVAGVVWAARDAGLDVPGLDVEISSTVPVGAGLSSSAALECSVGLAVLAAAGVDDDDDARRRLVDICRRAETEVAGAPTGGMDQTISLLARADHALLVDFSDPTAAWPETSHRRWSPRSDDVELVVIDTRAAHALVDGGYAARRRQCERAADLLGVRRLGELTPTDGLAAAERLGDDVLRRRTRHVVTEIERVDAVVRSVTDHDWAGVGTVLDASHASLRDDFEVSCPELDVACAAAVRAGALGARMTGGGFGGSAIALVPVELADAVRRRVADDFESEGWRPPGFLEAPAMPGARRIR